MVPAGAGDVIDQLNRVLKVSFQCLNVCVCIIPERCGDKKQL